MEFTYQTDRYYDAILNIAYKKYSAEVSCHSFLRPTTKQKFSDFFQKEFAKANCIAAIENDECIGYTLFSVNNESDEKDCRIPVWGYGANNQKVMSRLFTNLAEQIVTDKTTNFSMRLYAHDIEIQRLFSYMQFGIISEKAVREITRTKQKSSADVRKMEKQELIKRWDEVWLLLSNLIEHLRKSPVFYPGKKFTETIYKEFFLDKGTSVYIAEDKNSIVGLIEANPENYSLVFMDSISANVGEAYVLPQYRGTQYAQALLSSLEDDLLQKQVQYDWVEHGTANPNARGFWNKYFETFEYELIRNISL